MRMTITQEKRKLKCFSSISNSSTRRRLRCAGDLVVIILSKCSLIMCSKNNTSNVHSSLWYSNCDCSLNNDYFYPSFHASCVTVSCQSHRVTSSPSPTCPQWISQIIYQVHTLLSKTSHRKETRGS